MSIIHMSNRAPAIEIEYLNRVICTDKSYLPEDDISDLCECFFFIDSEKPYILDASFLEQDEDSSFMSFPYVGRWSQVFFDEFSSFRIDNWTSLEEDIARIDERLMIVDIWHDTDSVTILTEKMRHLSIFKNRRSIALSAQSEKSSMIDRTINFIEISTVDERAVFLGAVM
jgi:hypothetical protein